ncbi:MAG: thioredoxin family protein [Bacteroidetes bacterium]|nr:thioredoxin family protein [Bacteroidota bacterium]
MKFTFTPKNDLGFEEYLKMVEELSEQRSTTGNDKTEERAEFTKLNFHRMKRLAKTGEIYPEFAETFRELQEPQHWYVIVESWCGDAAQVLPYIYHITETNSNINLHIILRDDNPEIMDAFLTNGTRSIPKLIITDDEGEILVTWGPRPEWPRERMARFIRERDSGSDVKKADANKEIQLWYGSDKGREIQSEIAELIRTVSV